MGSFRIFNAKVILFGEYSVMAGSSVLIIPYPHSSAQFAFSDSSSDDDNVSRSNDVLSRFGNFINGDAELKEYIDTEAFAKDIAKGLYMNSTIPEHKGLGSSGALCAAVYDSYKNSEITHLKTLQQLFARMESFFHSTSSGVDPLSIYIGSPIIIDNSGYKIPEIKYENKTVPFLTDSGITCETAPLVNEFRKMYNQNPYGSEFRDNYVPLVNLAVNLWESGKLSMGQVSELSHAQTRFLSSMIPRSVKPVWNAGLETGLFSLKLCGSGGGGMFLGFTEKLEEAKEFLRVRFGMEIISL